MFGGPSLAAITTTSYIKYLDTKINVVPVGIERQQLCRMDNPDRYILYCCWHRTQHLLVAKVWISVCSNCSCEIYRGSWLRTCSPQVDQRDISIFSKKNQVVGSRQRAGIYFKGHALLFNSEVTQAVITRNAAFVFHSKYGVGVLQNLAGSYISLSID